MRQPVRKGEATKGMCEAMATEEAKGTHEPGERTSPGNARAPGTHEPGERTSPEHD